MYLTMTDFLKFSSTTLILIIGVLYLYYRYCFNYWKKRGVPTITPNFPVGNVSDTFFGNKSMFVLLKELYNEAKAKNYKHLGLYFFSGPVYMPIEPEIIKSILVTDFNYFADRGTYMNKKKYPLTYHLLSMPNAQWKTSRAKFTPIFSGVKLKNMYEILKTHSRVLLDVIDPLANGTDNVNIKDILQRFTTDIIGSTALGLECNSLTQPNSEFVRMISKIFTSPRWRVYLTILEEGLRNPGVLLKVTHRDRKIEKYFTNLIEKTIKYREENKILREDLFNILLKQKETNNMSFVEIVAQSWLFFTAGFETTSSTITNALHELAHDQTLQDELRKEIASKIGRKSTEYSYDELMKIPLLDRVIKETLRKYPPTPLLNRQCTRNYHVPGTDVEIEKGTPVVISIMAVHHQPDFYPDPAKFDPSRFDDEHQIQPGTYIPFGDGPRNCIGLRFATIEIKLALAALLSNYRFLPSPDTAYELEADPKAVIIVFLNKHPIYTKIEKLHNE